MTGGLAVEERYPPYQCLYGCCPHTVTAPIVAIVTANRNELAEIRNTPFRKSIEAERVMAESMKDLGFLHSVTNRKHPGLFKEGLNFEVDFFHPDQNTAVEVEKGEINNIWKNVCKFAESPLIRHGILLVPVIRKGQQTENEFYQNTIKRLCHMEKVFSLLDSVVIIGY